MSKIFRRSQVAAFAGVSCTLFFFSLALHSQATEADPIKPVPILTGSTAYFTRVNGGQFQNAPSVSPLLLMPLGDKWLLEGKGNYSDTFAKDPTGEYYGTNSYNLSYGQLDYITRYVTFTGGRFIVPFNIYG